MGITFSQLYPPGPTLTERTLPSQKGKVFIVTGGASGIGRELVTILFQAGGKIYIAGRSETNAQQCIEDIRSSVKIVSSAGQLEYLPLDLSDLGSIRFSAEAFKSKESKLDILWNNAGVSSPPIGSVSKQGHELQIGTNCLGPFLFTQLLLPLLQAAAQGSPQGSVRVIWTSSLMVELSAPKGGIIMADLASPPSDKTKNYVASKTGNWFLASELARKVGPQGILSMTQNPGNLSTNILRHAKWMRLVSFPLLYHAKMGAYTELWAGLSSELTVEMNGGYVIPWGRVHPSPREDLLDALRSVEEGGTGQAGEFWKWCEKQTLEYGGQCT
jgi:NAD(P)-dependent dehydrogenase (short-subunit alcohol dehydrogenase family)